MRRALLIAFLLLAWPAAAQAESVKVVACAPALDPLARSATFEARTRAYGSDRMQVRFTLQVREDALSAWRRVAAPGFDTWLTSDAGVRRYSYAKTVENLAAPAAYRTRRALPLARRGRRRDRPLAPHVGGVPPARPAPEPRPAAARRRARRDGRSAPLRRHAAQPGRERRRAVRASACAWATRSSTRRSCSAWRRAWRAVVTFVGPPCVAGMPLTVTADAAEAVDERDEDDNVLVAGCRP